MALCKTPSISTLSQPIIMALRCALKIKKKPSICQTAILSESFSSQVKFEFFKIKGKKRRL